MHAELTFPQQWFAIEYIIITAETSLWSYAYFLPERWLRSAQTPSNINHKQYSLTTTTSTGYCVFVQVYLPSRVDGYP